MSSEPRRGRVSGLGAITAAFLAGSACGGASPDLTLLQADDTPGVESDAAAGAADDAALTQAANGAWVALSGSDETGLGTAGRPFRTLERALRSFVTQKQKSLVTGTFTISVAPGTYALASPIAITAEHSGLAASAPLVIRAKVPGTVTLSGGAVVDTFALGEDGLWRAPVTSLLPGSELRQLWVNGRRAKRAASADAMGLVDQSCRSTSATVRACSASGAAYYLGPYKASSDVAARIARWREVRRVEVVNNDSYKQSRCLVDRVEGQLVYMQEPCWSDAHATANNGSYETIHPVRVENARELLDEPGEWYFEASTRTLVYWPLPGETISGTVAVVPRLERLLTIAGTPSAPVRDITLSGVSFAYTTWLRPSTGAGFPEYQANQLVSRAGDQLFPNAAVAVSQAQRVSVLSGSFVHLGGVGLDLGVSASAARVADTLFTDVSSSALFIGSRLDPASVNDGNVVEQNLVFDVGAEYQGAPAIVAGFTQRLVLQHNEIHDVPYTGISLGWGWSTSAATGNLVKANEIVRHMQVMDDGGGIYTLGDQPGTQIVENVVREPLHGYGGIYLDDCTSRVLVQSNVVWAERRPGDVTLGGVMAKGFSNTVLGNYLNDIEGHGAGVVSYTQPASTCSAKAALNGADNFIGSSNVVLTSLAGAPPSLVDGAGRTGAPLFSATIAVSPARVRPGQAAVITWTSVNASVCGSLGGFSTGGAVSGKATTGALTSTKSYQLSCTGPAGSFLSNVATVTVLAP